MLMNIWKLIEGSKHNYEQILHINSSCKAAPWQIITFIGTLNANRKVVPPDTMETKDRDENSWSPCKSNGLQLNSYVKTSSLVYKMFCCWIQWMRHILRYTVDEKMKPMICMIYDYTKRNIDIPDQRMGPYTIKVKTRNKNRVTEAATRNVL